MLTRPNGNSILELIIWLFTKKNMTKSFVFITKKQEAKARLGQIKTTRGIIDTPVFMPVGTCATVKAMLPENVVTTGAQIILGNAYHLMLRPTAERVSHLGGLHRFMNWQKPILTDSGGFQVMSLKQLRKIDEQGVEFRSFIDGSKYFLSPERSIEIQRLLGSDISMCFDECTPYPAKQQVAAKSMELSMRWAKRSKIAFEERPGYALFGIQQGSIFKSLREESTGHLVDIGFDGYAVGGLAVGEDQEKMFEVLDFSVSILPEGKPRYLMGVGKPSDIVGGVLRGIDMFDCVLPTRSGRNGQAFTHDGLINIKNARFKDDEQPLDDKCDCPACSNYSRAYLHHVFKSNEIISSMLLTWHNLRFYQILMARIRNSLCQGYFLQFAHDYLKTEVLKPEKEYVSGGM